MRIFAMLAAALAWSVVPALAAAPAGPMDPVNQFVDGMNHNNMKSAAAAYTPTASIIDEFPPHHWQGATAFADWSRDFGADSKKNGITDPWVTLGQPLQNVVTGDRAYVVVPTTYSFKQRGMSMRESDSIMTFALQKLAAGWRIAGWAWTARVAAH
jgi:hypothetical protein